MESIEGLLADKEGRFWTSHEIADAVSCAPSTVRLNIERYGCDYDIWKVNEYHRPQINKWLYAIGVPF